MKTIYKYVLKTLFRKNTILLPDNAKILSIQMQNNYPTVWAEVDSDAKEVKRIIQVYGTGDEMELIEPNQERIYLTTLQFPGNLVFHFFELRSRVEHGIKKVKGVNM